MTKLEVRRARRDAAVLRAIVPGDWRRQEDRAGRAIMLTTGLAAMGAPEPDRIAEALVRVVGARLTVDPAAHPQQLGFAIEVGVAGQSAFSGENDFGAWEIKTSFAQRRRPLPLFGWRPGRSEVAAVRSVVNQRAGMAIAGKPGLAVGRRVLRAVDETGSVIWRRSMSALKDGMDGKLDAVMMVMIVGRGELRIREVRLMWGLDTDRLSAAMSRQAAGVHVNADKLSLAVRRSQLHEMYTWALSVRPASWPVSRLVVVAHGGGVPNELRPGLSPQSHRRHRPALCWSCRAPLTAYGYCTACPREGFAC